MVKLIHENSERDLRVAAAMHELRGVAAQLMRLSAGAGSPERFEKALASFMNEIEAIPEGEPGPDSEEYREALFVLNSRPSSIGGILEHISIQGLRLTASRLTNSTAQEIRSERAMIEGIDEYHTEQEDARLRLEQLNSVAAFEALNLTDAQFNALLYLGAGSAEKRQKMRRPQKATFEAPVCIGIAQRRKGVIGYGLMETGRAALKGKRASDARDILRPFHG